MSSFLVGVGVVLAGAWAVVFYLRPHLRRILRDLCGSEERASFWTAFSNVVLVLVPVLCALFPAPKGNSATATFFDISEQLKWGLVGLIAAVVVLGIVLGRFIPAGSTSK